MRCAASLSRGADLEDYEDMLSPTFTGVTKTADVKPAMVTRTCTHARTQTHTRARTRAHAHTRTHSHTRARARSHSHSRSLTRALTHERAHERAHAHARTHTLAPSGTLATCAHTHAAS